MLVIISKLDPVIVSYIAVTVSRLFPGTDVVVVVVVSDGIDTAPIGVLVDEAVDCKFVVVVAVGIACRLVISNPAELS